MFPRPGPLGPGLGNIVGLGGSFPPLAMLPSLERQLLERAIWLTAGLMSLELLALCLPRRFGFRPRAVGLCQVLLVLGTLADAELTVRVELQPLRSVGIMAPDATRYWTFNRDTTHPKFTVNSHGLRGLPIIPDKRPGEFRILCLGNSVSAGDDLAEKETYPFLLQAYLRKRCPGTLIRVQNGAVYGYSTIQGRMVLEDVADEFKPDLVIVCFGRFEPSLVDANGEPLLSHRWPLSNLRAAAFESMLYLTLRQSLNSRLPGAALPGAGFGWLNDPQQVQDRPPQEALARRRAIEAGDQNLQGPLNGQAFWWFVEQSRKQSFKLVHYDHYSVGSPGDTPLVERPAPRALRDRFRQSEGKGRVPLTWRDLKAPWLSVPELAYIADVPSLDMNRTWGKIPNILDYMQDTSHPNVAGTVMQATDIGKFLLDQGLVPGATGAAPTAE